MKIKQWLFGSLRTKLITMFVILVTVPLIFVGLISYQKSYRTISEHAFATSSLAAEQIRRDVEFLLQETQILFEIGNHATTVEFLLEREDTYQAAVELLEIFRLYRQNYNFSNRIMDINIVNTEGKAISENIGIYRWNDNPDEHHDLSTLLTMPAESFIISSLPTPDRKPSTLSVASAIRDNITHEVIGFIMIDLDPDVFQPFLNQTALGDSGFFYIMDASGNVLFTPDRAQGTAHPAADLARITNDRGNYMDTTGDTDLLVVYEQINGADWIIVGQVPLPEIMKDARDIRNLILISVTCSIVFVITLYLFISARLIQPIRVLKDNMSLAASGNLDVKVTNDGQDEIADLSRSFNIMVKKIQMLMEKMVSEQNEMKKAELRTLQAQINPHFLYNTLDTIVWMAESRKSTQVIDITKALSHFFRITLSKGKDWVTLREETEHVRNYLMIQKMRYRDILDVEFAVDEEVLSYPILKLSLQPLLENAIYHGIKNKRGKGLIRIVGGFNDRNQIEFKIMDNGIGIPEPKLQQIRASLRQSTHRPSNASDIRGFGLKNVHQRIRLYYGPPFGLVIDSQYREGTQVTLTIPKKGEMPV